VGEGVAEDDVGVEQNKPEKERRESTMRRLAVMMVAIGTALATTVVALGLMGGGGADEAGIVSPIGQAEEMPSDGLAAEGIQVHGDWTIVVRNPDGSLAGRYEFQNALTSHGAGWLAELLAREESVGLWRVHLVGVPLPCNRVDIPNQATTCRIGEANDNTGWNSFDAVHSTNLSVEADGVALVLEGSVAAQNTTEITNVRTFPGPATWPNPLTSKVLNPIPVDAGQLVQVTVEISFS
jgi:hypothetical protein